MTDERQKKADTEGYGRKEEKMITNQTENKTRRPLRTETAILYHPEEGDWTYSHHLSICKFKDRFYAMWSNGKVNEDNPGQRVLYTFSSDGRSWAKPRVLMEPTPAEGVLTAAGFHVRGDVLTAYAGFFIYLNPDDFWGHKNTTLLCVTTKDGENWSVPADLGLPIVPNHGPQATRSGRLIICGNILFPYSDEPDGVSGWKLTGTDPFPWEPLCDDSQGWSIRAEKDGTPYVCEGSFYQTDDGVLHMLQRSCEQILYVTESRDDGATWSRSEKTGFTDCGSKFHCGRLPDGRFYIVSNPDPGTPRCPLVLTASRDGENFDREYVIADRFIPLRFPGQCKGGIYGYPHTLIDGDRMYVICSVNKEDVHVYTINLEDIAQDR